ncbi:hypothetical protein [Coprothermobacter platensis]|uniref:hypothetical protein n=1 Tax=Coprothermobacter platensis TaxID=108819 RepID=UPI00036783B7|nr:hypothetical protein [Coprothermobacter platensis]
MGSEDQISNDINNKLGNAFKSGARKASKAMLNAIKPVLVALLPYVLMIAVIFFLMLIVGSSFTYGGTDISFGSTNNATTTTPSNMEKW